MASNLGEFWQENKPFCTALIGIAAVFLIGEITIDYLYGEDLNTANKRIVTETKELKKPLATRANLEAVESMHTKLKTGISEMEGKTQFAVSADYSLVDGGASPENQYFDIVTKTREKIVRQALHNNIEVPEGMGLPTISPTGKEEITRYLRGLDLVQRAVALAVDSQVEKIDDLKIETQARGKRDSKDTSSLEEVRVRMKIFGNGNSLARFLESTQVLERPFILEKAKMSTTAKGERMVAELEFLALRFLGTETLKETPKELPKAPAKNP